MCAWTCASKLLVHTDALMFRFHAPMPSRTHSHAPSLSLCVLGGSDGGPKEACSVDQRGESCEDRRGIPRSRVAPSLSQPSHPLPNPPHTPHPTPFHARSASHTHTHTHTHVFMFFIDIHTSHTLTQMALRHAKLFQDAEKDRKESGRPLSRTLAGVSE